MQKKSPKLALRKETLRALSDTNLAGVVGGQESDVVDASVGKACPARAVAVKAWEATSA
jgi:hypothetical protein